MNVMLSIGIFDGTETLTQLAVMATLLVFVAMMIDLANGIYKAWVNGEARRSYLLKRTGSKFVLYIGSMTLAWSVDILTRWSHLWELMDVQRLTDIPIVSFLMAIFYIIVEFMSIREKADQKQKTELKRAEDLLGSVLDKISDKAVDALAERISSKIKGE